MKKFLCALLVLSYVFVYSQDYWVKQFDPFGCHYAGICQIEQSYDGGFILYGNITINANTELESYNGIMMKLDSDGEMVWASLDTLGSSSNGKNFVEFSDGEIYSISQTGFNRSNLIRRNEYGEIISSVQIKFGAESMCETQNENFIVVGQDMDSPIAMKMSPDGDSLWAFSPDYPGQFHSITSAPDGNYYTVGFQHVATRMINVVGMDEEGDVTFFVNNGLSGYYYHGASIAANESTLCVAGGSYYSAGSIFYGLLAVIDISSQDVFVQNIDCQLDIGYTSVTNTENGTFAAFGTNLAKLDEDLVFDWSRNYSYNYGGDRSLCFLPDEGYIFPISNDTTFIEIVKTDLTGEVNSVSQHKGIENNTLLVLKNYPNPFNPVTTIRFTLQEKCPVSIEIYNIKGQLVQSLLSEEKEAGSHSIIWDGTDNQGHSSASGVYFCRINANENEISKKMLLLK